MRPAGILNNKEDGSGSRRRDGVARWCWLPCDRSRVASKCSGDGRRRCGSIASCPIFSSKQHSSAQCAKRGLRQLVMASAHYKASGDAF